MCILDFFVSFKTWPHMHFNCFGVQMWFQDDLAIYLNLFIYLFIYLFLFLQIKLLLQQQPTPLPNPNALLTPPRTPQFDSSCPNENRKLPNHSPVSMVTACTNTGESLLLGTPIKPNGKKSAATSPIKEQEMSHKER